MGGGEKGSREKGGHAAGRIIYSGGMLDSTKRGLLKEMVKLKGGLGFLNVADMGTREFKDVIEFGRRL